MKKLLTFSALFIVIVLQAQKKETVSFQPTLESFKAYRIPEWFRDAKFGI